MKRLTLIGSVLALVGTAACSGGSSPEIDRQRDALANAGPSSIIAPDATRLVSGNCPFSPAPVVLSRAVCVCEDLTLAGALETRAPAGSHADVGVNGRFTAATDTQIAGALLARDGVGVSGEVRIAGDLASRGDVIGAGQLAVGRDLASGGSVTLSGSLDVAGAARVAGQLIVAGEQHVASRAAFAPIAEPCGCSGSGLFDIATRVAAAKITNDNAKHGVPTEITSVGDATLALDTGTYYLTSLTGVGLHHVRVTGAVALHIDGDLTAVGAESFDLAPGASLDLFVSGDLTSAGDLDLGTGASAASFRLYVGGDAMVHAGAQTFHGLLYAPHATVAFAGDTIVHGAVFAKALAYSGRLVVDYAAPAAPAPTTCQSEPSSDGPAPK